MKLKVDQALLKNALRRASVGGAQSSILGYVRGNATKGAPGAGDVLQLYATNGSTEIELSLACVVEAGGEFVVHCKALSSGAGSMPSGELTLSVSTKKKDEAPRVHLVGSSGRRWSIATSTVELPPTHAPMGKKLVLPTALLQRLIERTEFATMNTLESYRERDGIRIEVKGELLTACVWGSNIMFSDATKLASEPWQALIPSPLISSVKDIIEEAEQGKAEAVTLSTDDTRLYIVGPSSIMSTTLPVGEYPNWQEYVDRITNKPVATIPRLAVIESLRALDASLDVPEPSAILSFQGDQLLISASGENTAFSDQIQLADARVDGQVTLKAHVTFLAGALKAADQNPELVLDDSGMMLLVRTESGFRAAIALLDANR